MKYFNKALALFLCAAFIFLPACSVPPSNDGGEPGGDVTPPGGNIVEIKPPSEGLAYEARGPRECVITGIGTCTDEDIVIPDYIGTMKVVEIAARAFAQKEGVDLAKDDAAQNGNSPFPTPRPMMGEGKSSVSFLSVATEEEEEANDTVIRSVSIPLTVTAIGKEAFLGCEELADLETTRLLQLVGRDAFKDTAFYNDESNWENGLLYVETTLAAARPEVSGTVTLREGTTVIADRIFYGNTAITGIEIPSSVRSIGNYAFYGCTGLGEIRAICRDLIVGVSAFEGCTSLRYAEFGVNEDIYTPTMDGVEQAFDVAYTKEGTPVYTPLDQDVNGRPFVYAIHFRYKTFSGCSSLAEVKLNKNVANVGSVDYEDCVALESIVISDNVTETMGIVFRNCTKLSRVTFGKNMTRVSTQTFYKCPALTELSFPDGVAVVEDVAWFSGVKRLNLGSGLRKISWTQGNLEYIAYNGTVEEWAKVEKGLLFLAQDCIIQCTDGIAAP